MDSIGNIPVYIAVLKDCHPASHKLIIVRELLIALGIIIAFYFIGNYLLSLLGVHQYAVMISGGIILFVLAIQMIFTGSIDTGKYSKQTDPLVVPLAVPLVAGPAVLAAVMLYSHESYSTFIVIISIIIAWAATTIILLASTFLQKVLSDRGVLAVGRLMGLILTLIAVQMFLHGLTQYNQSIASP